MGFFSTSKDRLVETMAPGLLNTSVLEPYGRLVDFKLNSDAGELDVTLELKGEVEPLRVHIQEYELIQQSGRMYILIHRIHTSRPWLTALAENLALGRKIEIPSDVAKHVSRFL
jgi:hypothetical protein